MQPAPALARGLDVLSTLCGRGPMSLEGLSSLSSVPKASLLRILRTLESKGCVGRDPVSRRFSALVAMVPAAERTFAASVHEFIVELSEKTRRTVEFYVLDGRDFRISARRDCEGAGITVKALIGFRRKLDGEFEAVARIAHAFGPSRACHSRGLWSYEGGVRRRISSAEYGRLLAECRKERCTADFEFNSNGVRRSAAPVFKGGALAGIVALAENYFPGCDIRTRSNLAVLRRMAGQFSEQQEKTDEMR